MTEYIYEHSQCHAMHSKSSDATMLVQREEVVRCKDCRFEIHNKCTRNSKYIDGLWFPVDPNGFCKWGEREVKRENELEPCPFCGGEVAIRYEPNCDLHYVHCDACGAETGNSGLYRDRDKAVKAWNTRAERTCRNVLGDGHFGCSVCGCHVRNLPLGSTYMSDGKRWYSTEKRAVNYCPHCGAKVVKE